MALRSPRILEIFTGTWNMGNAAPDRDALEQFIPHHGGPYDVLAIGLQESQYKVAAGAASAKSSSVKASSSGGNLTKTSSFLEKLGKALDPSIADLLQQICDILGPEYHVVDHASRYQMQLVVFAHATLLKSITHVEKTAENTGILHVLPNKGGLCISFTVDDTKVAFIAAHLAAHEGPKKCAVRNDNVCEILGGVRAGDRRFDVCAQCHHVFFMGDLNYRLALHTPSDPAATAAATATSSKKSGSAAAATEVDDDDREDGDEDPALSQDENRLRLQERVYAAIADGNWYDLHANDELIRELHAGRAFPGFSTALPLFPPTFKRIRHQALTTTAERRESGGVAAVELNAAEEVTEDTLRGKYYDKKRIPAYTDRVLFRSLPGFVGNLRLQTYESIETASTSDHKPVRAAFELETTSGPLDILNDPQGSKAFLVLELSHLKGKDLAEMDARVMGMGGGSDPYIVVHTDPPCVLASEPVKSRTITHDLNPDWGDDKLTLKLSTHDVEGLARNAHLIVSVWDYDRFNEDDLIGVCSLSFKAVLGELAQQWRASKQMGVVFSEPLLSNGRVTGRLEGVVSLAGAVEAHSEWKSALREYASEYVPVKTTAAATSKVPVTSQAHPHDLQKPPPPPPPPIRKELSIVDPVVDADGNLEEPEPLPEVPAASATLTSMQAMRVEASMRPPHPATPDGSPAAAATATSSSSFRGAGPPQAPPVPTPPPVDAINPGARKLSLKIGDKEVMPREKKDLGERVSLADAAAPSAAAAAAPGSGSKTSGTDTSPAPAAAAAPASFGGGGMAALLANPPVPEVHPVFPAAPPSRALSAKEDWSVPAESGKRAPPPPPPGNGGGGGGGGGGGAAPVVNQRPECCVVC